MEVFVISCRCCYLGFATVAILVFLSATAGAGVVSSYFGGGFYRFGALLRSIGLCAVVLLRASYLLFLGTIPAVILSCFGCSFFYLLRVARRYLSTHKDRYGFGIDGIDHFLEESERFEFEDKQRVLLFVAGVLHRLAQLVEVA